MTTNLPPGWKVSPLVDIATLIMGQSPESKYYNTSGEGLPFFQGKAEFGELYPVVRQYCSAPKKVVEPHDILLSVRAPVGPTNLAKEDSCIGRGLAGIRPKKDLNYQFLLYQFRHLEPWLSQQGTGSTFQAINKSFLEKVEILVPSLSEQKRIVARLDQLLARVDSCRAHLDRAAAAIKRFRQSVLNAAVTGQLTYELNLTMNKNLEQIADFLSKQSNLKKNETDKLTVSLDYDLPPHWCTAPLGLLISACSYGSSQKSAKTGLIPVLRMGNIQSGILDWEDLVYTSDQTEIDKYLLEPGDVLFNRTNSPELVGKTAMYKEGAPKAIYAGYLIRVKTLPALNPQFLTYCLNSSYGRHFSWQVKTDGVSQSNINASKLCAFPTPICSRTEQDEIVRRAEALFQKADEMESKLTTARERVDNLTASILAKAFRGELL